MDKAIKGHSRTIQLSSPWSISTSIYEDELLSSWLIRAAMDNGCDPIALTSFLWGDWRPWTIDFDRTISDEKLSVLAKIFSTDISTFQTLTLRPTLNKITAREISNNQLWPWMLTTGARNKNRSYGLQYCPLCFEEGAKYYKRSWRLAWHTCCNKHGKILLQICHNCQLPIEPHKLEAMNSSITNCSNCGSSLLNADTSSSLKGSRLFQVVADEVLQTNIYKYHNFTLNSHQWFELNNFFILLIKRIAKRNHQSLLTFGQKVELPISSIPKHLPVFESVMTPLRAQLLSSTWHLLNLDLEVFQQSLLDSNVSKQAFSPKEAKLPACMQPIYSQLPMATYGQKNVDYQVPLLPRPRPKHEVKKRAVEIIRALR